MTSSESTKGDLKTCNECKRSLIPSNSASNFQNPALSVKRAVELEEIHVGDKILEVGAGNLRNSLYLLVSLKDIEMHASDLDNTSVRFPDKYAQFRRRGGKISKIPIKTKFDKIICTFVAETICPLNNRIEFMSLLKSALKRNGALVLSVRGYPGVYGTKYRNCPLNQGLISPLRTFIKPYSISELNRFLKLCGFNNIIYLQNYKSDKPQNIHCLAF